MLIKPKSPTLLSKKLTASTLKLWSFDDVKSDEVSKGRQHCKIRLQHVITRKSIYQKEYSKSQIPAKRRSARRIASLQHQKQRSCSIKRLEVDKIWMGIIYVRNFLYWIHWKESYSHARLLRIPIFYLIVKMKRDSFQSVATSQSLSKCLSCK